MPMLEIDGIGKVEVGPEFLRLPPDQQAAEVDNIALTVKPVTSTPEKPVAGTPEGDAVVTRGSILPVGRTAAGELTPAAPEFIHGPMQTIKDLLDGKRQAQDISGKEIFDLGMLFGGSAAGGAAGTGAGVARAAARSTPEELAAMSGRGVPGLRAAVPQATEPLASPVAREAIPGAAAPEVAAAAPAPALTTAEDFKAAGQAFYKKAEDAGVVIKPEAYQKLAVDTFEGSAMKGLDPTLTPDSTAALKRIGELADPKVGPISFKTLDLMRQIASDAQSASRPSDRRIAGHIVDKIDDFVANMSEKDVVAGNPKDAAEAIGPARQLWSTFRKLSEVDRLIDRAQTSAPNFSGSGFENALRTEFRTLAKNDAKMRTYTPEERDAIKKVARGGPLENTARAVGKLAPTGVVSGVLGGGAGAALGTAIGVGPVVGAAAAGGLGFSARHLATVLTRRNVAALQTAIRNGGDTPAAQSALRQGQSLLSKLSGATTVPAAQGIDSSPRK